MMPGGRDAPVRHDKERRVSETTTPARSGGTEPELRRVTVLFADIQGSTALIQGLNAEDAADLIDPALQAMIEAAERFAGAVSHRGDGIMAVFGAPTVAEDHALRACLAALAMQDAVDGDGIGRVKLRIGIHSGEVVFRPVRIGGVLMHDAVGIAVHIAARLEQSADTGTIVVSDAVRAIAEHYIRTTPLEPVIVKGVDAPIQSYRLLGADPTTDRWRVRAARGLSPFVGRAAEIQSLEAWLARGGVRAAHVIGPAGIGKSRLVHEWLRRASGRSIVAFTGDRNRHAGPFHPVIAWLRAWLDIRDSDSVAERRAKLAAGLAELRHPEAAPADQLERLLGIGDRATMLARIDFGPPIAALIGAQAAGRDVIVVCEEADSFDSSTLELIESALPHLASPGVLLLTLSRARVRMPGLPPGAAQTLLLAPLSDSEASALLGGIDAGRAADPALAADILRKAGGNPLFLEEVAPLVSATVPRELDATIAVIPGRVEELIADRLGRLSPDLRRLVQLCAVVGPDVPARVIGPLSGMAEAELQPALERLADEQLLYESRRYPDAMFSFKHALTRDVAYGTILAARRRAHHSAIVDILIGEGEAARERNIDELCYHSQRAQRWDDAITALRQASSQAIARTAFPAAMAALRRARDIADMPAATGATERVRLDILIALESVARWVGSYAELTPILDEIEARATALGDRAHIAKTLATRVHVANILGQLDHAIALGERARRAAEVAGDAALHVTASFYTGQSNFNAGRLAEAERVLGETLDRPENVPPYRTLCLGTRAMSRAMRGDFVAAMDDIAVMNRCAAETVRPYDHIFADAVTGFVAHERRDAAVGMAAFASAIARSEAAGIIQLLPPALAGLGHAQLVMGDHATASETLSRAHRMSRVEQRWMFQLSAGVGMAHASLALGEPDLARGFAEEAVAIADRYGFAAFRVPAMRALGMVMAATRGGEAEGAARLREALAAAEAAGMLPETAHAHAALAIAGVAGGERHRAEAAERYGTLGLDRHLHIVDAAMTGGRTPYL